MKASPAIAILVIFTLFTGAGAFYVYGNDCGSYDATASMNADGTISYTLSGPNSEYRYSVFSNTKIPDKVYMYCDESYASDFCDVYTQNEFLHVLASMLERRGMATGFVDAEQLADIMAHPEYGVFFASGALPSTVYDGNPGSLFEMWMTSGGTVYWTGPEIGRYISSPEGVTDLGTGFFGGNVNTDEKNKFAYDQSDMFAYTQTRYDDCLYGLKADAADSLPLGYISEGNYSSVSVARLFGGNVTVFGGNVAVTKNVSQVVTDRTCCADLMICGLTYQSQGLDCGNGKIMKNVSSSTSADVSSASDRVFFISTGGPASDWAKTIPL